MAPFGGVLMRKTGNCVCGGGCPRCQEKYVLQARSEVSQPGEPLEQEADRIAERVMRRPAQRLTGESAVRGTGATPASRASPEPAAAASPAAPAMIDEALRGPHKPLDATARNFFGPRFGRDFGEVRVRTGPEAAASARALNAQAYTFGRDIVFGAGQYDAHTAAGRRLLAHELAHVVQQERGPPGPARVLRQRTIVVDNLGCPRESCAGKEDGIKADLRRALTYTAQALSALDGKPSAETGRVLDWYFSDRSDATVKTVRERLGWIQTALQDSHDNERYGCGARIGAHAHTGGSPTPGEDSGAPVCLNPSYFDVLSSRERAEALVHECGHRVGLSSGGTPDILSTKWRFLSLSNAEALLNTESYAMFVGAIAYGARITWMPLFGVGGGLTSLGGGFGKVHLGVEAQHPKLRGISPSAGLSFALMDSEAIASLFFAARLADARPGKKVSIYLNLSGELSLISGDKLAVGEGAEAKLGVRVGRFDIGLTGGILRDPSPDAGTRTVYTGGLSIAIVPDFWSK